MKSILLSFTKLNKQVITKKMFFFVIFALFGSLAYSQIATTTPASRCGEGTLVLNATATSGTIKWFTVPFYGTAIATGPSFTTPSLIVLTTYYVDAVDGTGCSLNPGSARVPVIATVGANSVQASIFYPNSALCKSVNEAQIPTRTGNAGGVYSAVGLTIDPVTGSFVPSANNAGTYDIYYTPVAAQGCVENPAFTQVTITTPPSISSISYAGSPFCTSAAPVGVNLVNNNNGIFSASPSGLHLNATTGEITPSLSFPGTYTVTYAVAGNGGCEAQNPTTEVTIVQLPTASISYAGPFCSNSGNQLVNLTGTGDYTGGVFSATGGLSIDPATGTINPTTAGNFTVTYTLAAVPPCAQVVATTNITVHPLPTATISGTATICNGGSTNLSIALTGTQPWSFTYTDGTTPVTVNSQATSPYTVSVNPTSTKTYSVIEVSDVHCNGTNSGSAIVTVNQPQLATFEYSGSPYCSDGVDPSPNMLGVGTKGIFTSTAGLVFANASTGVIDLSASTAGTYIVTNTLAANGCPQVAATASVTITKLPIASFSYASASYCTNGVNPSPVMGVGAVKGLFTSTAGLEFVNIETGEINLSASTPGNYVVTNTIAAASGCGVVTATFNVEIKAIPAAVAGSGRGICAGSSTVLGAPAVIGNTYAWTSTPAGFTSTEAQPTVSPVVNTTYTLVETNGSCSNTHNVVVEIITPPAANAISGTASVCQGATNVSYSVTDHTNDGGFYNWQYTGTGATFSSLTSPTTTITFANNATSGVLTLTENLNGCSTNNTFNITVAVNPSWGAITSPAASITVGSSVNFSAAVNNGLGGTVTWIRSTTPGGAGVTVVSGDIPPAAGIYYYRPHYAASGLGCSLVDGTETMVSVAPAAPSGVSPQSFCSAD